MDRGSVFTVWLPMDLTPEPDELPDEITDMESTGMKKKRKPLYLRQMRI